MSSNCLITKLKASVDNDSLPKLGELIFPVHQVATEAQYRAVQFEATEEITVSTDGTGYFSTVLENVDTDKLTSITISPDTVTKLYFNDGEYNIHVSNKYALTQLYGFSDKNITKRFFGYADIGLFKYSTNMEILRLANSDCFGSIKDLASLSQLETLSIPCTKISGTAADLGCLINVRSLRFYDTNISGTVEEFVAAQIENGRTTASAGDIESRGMLSKISFGGQTVSSTSYYYWPSWESSSKIVIYRTSSPSSVYNYSNVTTVYAKGATAEEISQWETDGKEVIEIS